MGAVVVAAVHLKWEGWTRRPVPETADFLAADSPVVFHIRFSSGGYLTSSVALPFLGSGGPKYTLSLLSGKRGGASLRRRRSSGCRLVHNISRPAVPLTVHR